MFANRPKLSSEQYRFSFAVVSDTHVKAETADDSSPWKVNLLGAGRARWIAREVGRYNPGHVIHLGDLVHPIPGLPTRGPAAEQFHSIFCHLQDRLHVVPGNHDVGDKLNRMMPVEAVRDDWVDIYERSFGPSWSSFDHDDIRFVLINSVILNTGTQREHVQRRWLEETLHSADGRRIFLFTHYAPFPLRTDEDSNYDNIDEPGRTDLLGLIAKYRVEAVISGHVHTISYHHLNGTEFYVIPGTCFIRQDLSEMFRSEAIHENGRNDAEKLGFAIVDIYRGGHVVHYLSSYGQTITPSELAKPISSRSSYLCLPHPKKHSVVPLGVFLRHPWAETTVLPHNGPLDEFERKEARNDFQLAALWRMGIQRTRVPLSDILNPTTRARMADLVAIGHRFTVFGFGIPTAANETLCAHVDLIDRYECVLPLDMIPQEAASLADFRAKLGRPVLLARVDSSADSHKKGARFEHFVAHGFRPEELPQIERLHATVNVDGFVIRANLGTDLVDLAQTLDGWSARHQCLLDLHLRLASNNPAENIVDDRLILAGVIELFLVGLAYPRLSTMLDTFMDIDRGYFVRHGLIDRRCNLQPAGLAVEALAAFLGGDPSETWSLTKQQMEGITLYELRSQRRSAFLASPAEGSINKLDHQFLQAKGINLAASTVVKLDKPWTIDPTLGSYPPAMTVLVQLMPQS